MSRLQVFGRGPPAAHSPRPPSPEALAGRGAGGPEGRGREAGRGRAQGGLLRRQGRGRRGGGWRAGGGAAPASQRRARRGDAAPGLGGGRAAGAGSGPG